MPCGLSPVTLFSIFCHQVPWTCGPSGSLPGSEPDLPLWWVVLFILAVPAFSTSAKGPVQICASVAEELAGKNVIEYLTLFYVPGLPFFLERAHIFTNVPVEAFFCCCP